MLREWYAVDRLTAQEALARRFWAGEGRAVATLMAWPHPYRQTHDDALMRAAAPRQLQATAALPGLHLPCFHADFGTISTAKYWGGTPRFDSGGDRIFLDPVARTLEQALDLEPLPVDDPTQDAAHGLRLYRQLAADLETSHLWLRTPDFQGALTTAGLVVDQTELLMAMVAAPDLAHRFVDRVTDFLIAYGQYLRRETGDRLCGNIWPDTFLPSDLGMSFTEDLMPLLSVETYREYAVPILRRFQEAFGGLHIHCCGDWGRHAPTLAGADLRLLAVEYHHPFTRIEDLACLAPRTVFVPMLNGWLTRDFRSSLEYFRHLLANTPENCRYWFIVAEDNPAAREFVTEVMAAWGPAV
jgi:hypothetical protein